MLDIEKEKSNNRCNDGACDCEGRLWIGTMDRSFKEKADTLYCIDKNFLSAKKVNNVTISNGMTWSLGNDRFYYIDSPRQTVTSFLFDAKTGNINFEKITIQ